MSMPALPELAPLSPPAPLRAKLGLAMVMLGCMLGLAHVYTQPGSPLVAVNDFEAQRYAGQWYDITSTPPPDGTAVPPAPNSLHFDLQANGDFRITQRSLNPETRRWHTRYSHAFTGDKPGTGVLRMPLFGPFYEHWHIVAMDPDYQWALLVNADQKVRLLARTPQLQNNARHAITAQAQALGLGLEQWAQTMAPTNA